MKTEPLISDEWKKGRSKKNGSARTFKIETRFRHFREPRDWGEWRVHKRYHTEKDRDKAFDALCKQPYGRFIEYRKPLDEENGGV